MVDGDIGTTVQAHDADTAKLDANANFTGTLQRGGTNVLVAGDVTNANFTGADLEIAKGGTGASTAGAARTALGLAIGTDVLAPDGDGSGLTGVDSLPSQTSQSGKFLTTNGSAASWGEAGSSVVRISRTSNTILDTSNNSKLIDITSGTFTQTFTAAATLGSGWFVYLKNSGTGDITIDPSGSETIDGVATFVMYPSESRLIQCDGTSFFSTVLTPFYKTFTSSATFTQPTGYSSFSGLIWGAGGGGSKRAGAYKGGGGGGGACVPFTFNTLSATVTVTIGAGGAGKTSSDGSGGRGGNTTFGSYVTSYGGDGSTNGGGGGGAFSNGSGTSGGQPITSTSGPNSGFGGGAGGDEQEHSAYGGGGGAYYAAAGKSLYGGGGGSGSTSDSAGISVFGGDGGAGNDSGNGGAGTAPAGGGGGTGDGNGGNGARGELRIWGAT